MLFRSDVDLAARGLAGDLTAMLGHATDYLDLFATVCVAWQWIRQAAAARRRVTAGTATPFHQGKLRAAQYWVRSELPRVALLADLCREVEDSYLGLDDAQL